MARIKIVVDNKIPYIKEPLAEITENTIYLPGSEITTETIKDADVLITRTRTKCNRQLLEGSKIKFIGTATIGFDHIDTEYCDKAGITWKNCPGCNAGAVEQYIHAALALLEKEKGYTLSQMCIGIVGVGHVGTRIKNLARGLGMRVLLNDPPRRNNGEDGFVDIETITKECEIITFHTPLITDGAYKTYHLADEHFFNALRKKPIIINTSRGEVVDTKAILNAINNHTIAEAVIDVWENEPNINLDLLNKVYIGTPHIAGYSANGKFNATKMTLEHLYRFLKIDKKVDLKLPEELVSSEQTYGNNNILLNYNPKNDYELLLSHPEDFEKIRGNYRLRKE